MVKAGIAAAGLLCLATPVDAQTESMVSSDACRSQSTKQSVQRVVTPQDIVELTDLSWPTSVGSDFEPSFSIAPDGQRVAFELRIANPITNRQCAELVVMPLGSPSQRKVLDRYPEIAPALWSGAKPMPVLNGSPAEAKPRWSKDSLRLLYLRRTSGVTQVWMAVPADGSVQQITHSHVDVEDVVWAQDGRSALFLRQPERREERAALSAEARSGYLYDDRFFPKNGKAPLLANIQPEIARIYLADGRLTKATEAERALLIGPSTVGDSPIGGRRAVTSALGFRFWREAKGRGLAVKETLQAELPDGRRFQCNERCSDLQKAWWDSDGRTLRFVRREGWASSQLAFYRWRPGKGKPNRTFVTNDLLLGCQSLSKDMLCAHEASIQPRRLVRLDPDTGRMQLVFDPNPQWRNFQLGQVERLHWRNAFGIETFGDLLLPPDHKPGQRHPLIVVQYSSRGFLRGGTGDEYPIQAFAAKGYAVLSFQRPRDTGYLSSASNSLELAQANLRDWSDRRSVQSSLEKGIQTVIGRGVVDPGHMGITGLSDGAVTVEFALVNSALFKAAAVSSCCQSPGTHVPLSGPFIGGWFKSLGYPAIGMFAGDFWKPYSMVMNASRVSAPLLMQLSDNEYMGALEVYTALKDAQKAVEMYVFADEHHVKSQPAHRLAIYRRNLQWFDFWLMDQQDINPVDRNQYIRWRRMREVPPAK